MSKAVKAAGLGLVIFATVWGVTIWQWYGTQRNVSGKEVATQLVLLPLILSVIAGVAWWGAGRLRALAAKPIEAPSARADGSLGALLEASQPPASGDGGAAGAVFGDEAGRPGPGAVALAAVLAEAVSLPAGHDAEAAWEGLRAGQVRPALDNSVLDPDGLPVFTARQAELDTTDWLHAHAELAQGPDPVLPEAVLRSLALLEGPLHELLDCLMRHVPAPAARAMGASDASDATSRPQAAAHLSGVGASLTGRERADAAARAPALSISLCLPAHWSDADRARAVAWVKERCGAIVDWMRAWGAREPHWQVAPPASPEALWSELSEALQHAHADPRPSLHLVLAADSLVDEDTVLRMLARGELFTHQHQGGRVPGEAGVGLLLANPAWLALHGVADAAHAPRLGWPLRARREQSADRIGRVGATTVADLMRQALGRMQARVGEGALHAWWLVSDGDHRASRSAELYEAMQAVQADLDPLTHVVRAGDACGDMGMARALVPVALASSAVRQSLSPHGAGEGAIPALVSLVQCSHNRVLVPIWPATLVVHAEAQRLSAPPSSNHPPRSAMPASAESDALSV